MSQKSRSRSRGSQRLFIRGLPADTKRSEVSECFGVFGRIRRVKILRDASTCVITFESCESTELAIRARTTTLRGSKLEVSIARSREVRRA